MNARALFFSLLLVGTAWAAERPRIDVAFCIDTTGSMQPHIDAVKKKVWEIANELLKGKPTPIVRLGVVAYRDRNEAYVTQHIDLTDDIDKVHKYLMELKADGGGDRPEHLTAGLRDAVEKLQWSSGSRVLKAIYVVGDAPAHADYPDGDYKVVAKAAVTRGINIHTISCMGSDEVPQFKEIAKLADGQFIQMPVVMASRGRAPAVAPGKGVGALDKLTGKSDAGMMMEGGAAPAAAEPAPMAAPADASEAMSDSIVKTLKDSAKKRGVADY
jgi:Mg-chelatase subunit ChlD